MKISITRENLDELNYWFTNYVHTFQNSDSEIQQNIDMKEGHTKRVCKEIVIIGKQLGLNDDEQRLAEIIGLLHDIGRFEQYSRYKTFMDKKSENHAELGIKILAKFDVLKSFDKPVQEIILQAIKHHNRSSLPLGETDRWLFYAKLIRDADKLDILKVVTDYYYQPKINRAIELDLPDTPGFSEEVYRDLICKRTVDMKYVRNLNDIKLLQVGWIFDINFQPTIDSIIERRYLDLILGVLPKSKKMDEIFEVVHSSLVN